MRRKTAEGLQSISSSRSRGPGFVVVVAVVVAVTAQLHPMKVLVGLGRGARGAGTHGRGGEVGMADKGCWRDGRQAGRCHACSQGRRGERVAGKKNV